MAGDEQFDARPAEGLEKRVQLLNKAVELVLKDGLGRTNLKRIASEVGMSDAEVYQYFASLDQLFRAYYEIRAQQALAAYGRTGGLDDFSAAEKFQLSLDTLVETLIPDREFLTRTARCPSPIHWQVVAGLKPLRIRYQQLFAEIMEAANARGEYPPCTAQASVCSALGRQLQAIMVFWLEDRSAGGRRTNKLIELFVQLLDTSLRSGTLNSLFDLKRFMLRPVIEKVIMPFDGLFRGVRQLRELMDV